MRLWEVGRVGVAWALVVAIGAGAMAVVVKLAVVDAPPGGALFITGPDAEAMGKADSPSATITPYGGTASARLLRPAPAPGLTIISTPEPIAKNVQSMPTGTVEPTTQAESRVAPSPTLAIPSPEPTATVTQATIAVYISGAVTHPGVYVLPEGARAERAVEAAGGATKEADLDGINLAQKLVDEEQIIVPTKGEAGAANAPAKQAERTVRPLQPTRPERTPTAQAQRGGGGAKPTPAAKINLNSATEEQLQTIPGIGPALAARIVADREQNGPYPTLESLSRIPGIKEGIIARIAPYVTVP